jgi:hypothetical protein
MVERKPLLECCIESLKSVGNRLFTIKEAISDCPEESLNFSTTTWFSRRCMDEMNTEISADKLEVFTCIAGPVIGIMPNSA